MPVVRWKNRMKEYIYETGAARGRGFQQAGVYRERWRLF